MTQPDFLSVCFLVATESELSHFTDRAVARLSVLSKVIKQACERCKNIITIASGASSPNMESQSTRLSFFLGGGAGSDGWNHWVT